MTDIRVGDLVKATSKKHPERTVTFRATYVSDNWVEDSEFAIERDEYDLEVLDRLAPPIDEDLLEGATNAYRKGAFGYKPLPGVLDSIQYRRGLEAVINFVREYDKKNATKENAK